MIGETPSDSEEDIFVYVEFENSVNIENYRNVHVLGIDEINPIIQMDDTFFTGKYESPLGTFMFFQEDPNPVCSDHLFDRVPERNLKYILKTSKYVNMEHAYVSLKEEKGQNPVAANNKDNDIEVVEFKTVSEALEKFKSVLKPANPKLEITDSSYSHDNNQINVQGAPKCSPAPVSHS